MKTILITGAAGFIGFHLAQRLLREGHAIVGIDNLNHYYDVKLKKDRLALLKANTVFTFYEADVADAGELNVIFEQHKFDRVIHLAAQAGVRYSIDNPHAYVESNLVGFVNVLEACRQQQIEHLVYASSSSVYGNRKNVPFREDDNVDNPISLYAATKKSNELMAHSYAHLYDIATTGLRFFTVYGPWGRPDMAYYKFANAICAGKAIDLYNDGEMQRDFTYIDDVVEGIVRVMDAVPIKKEGLPPYRILNIGNSKPEQLKNFVDLLVKALGPQHPVKKNMLPMQAGDVTITYANTDRLEALVGYKPLIPISDGLANFAAWYIDYHGLDQQNQLTPDS